jgi:hypothetical protein
MKYMNTNPTYGDQGPFEAESMQELIKELKGTIFYDWAKEAIFVGETDEHLDDLIEEYAIEFEKGLVEVI